jgi:hypothetical protein
MALELTQPQIEMRKGKVVLLQALSGLQGG